MSADDLPDLKKRVKDHWETETCGTRYAIELQNERREFFSSIERNRYEQDYMLPAFAGFEEARGKKVLEVGVGAGTDFVRWVRAGAAAYGIDLTEASIRLVKERLQLEGLKADVAVGDAEELNFPENYFDIYYSWGVLHHTPNIEKALAEGWRVLKPSGIMKVMLYHYPSVSAWLIWIRYGLLRADLRSPRTLFSENVESPGTQLFTRREVEALFGRFFERNEIEIRTYLGSGDLLTHKFSRKYPGWKWQAARWLYPRSVVKHVLGHRFGTVMTIRVTK